MVHRAIPPFGGAMAQRCYFGIRACHQTRVSERREQIIFEIEERGEICSWSTGTTRDEEIGKSGSPVSVAGWGEENLPRPFGLRRKLAHTSLSASTVDPPQPSASASYELICARNADSRSLMTRPRPTGKTL